MPLPVGILAVCNHHDGHEPGVILNLVDDPVVTHSNPPRISPGQLDAPVRTRSLGKRLQRREESAIRSNCFCADRKTSTAYVKAFASPAIRAPPAQEALPPAEPS